MYDANATRSMGRNGTELEETRASARSMMGRLAAQLEAQVAIAGEYEAQAEAARAAGDAALARVMSDWAVPHRREADGMRVTLERIREAYRSAYGDDETPGSAAASGEAARRRLTGDSAKSLAASA